MAIEKVEKKRAAFTTATVVQLGAMVGGALEYLALIAGYRALLLLVAVLYVGAYLLATRWPFLADRELEARPEAIAEPLATPSSA